MNSISVISAGWAAFMVGTLAAPALGAQGGEAATWSEQTFVTGTRLHSRLADLDGSHTIIDRQQIELRNKSSVIELLRSVPGLQISQQGGRGGVSVLYMRGAEPNFTLVMIDGIEVNDPTNSRGGGFDFSSLEMDSIERIEIIHGSQSAIYGSGALAGVINIVTLQGRGELSQTLSTDLGRKSYHESYYRASGESGKLSYALTLGASDAGDVLAYNEFDARHVNIKLNGQLLAGELQWVGRYANMRRAGFPEDSGGESHASMRNLDREELHDYSTGLRLKWPLGDRLHTVFEVSWFSRSQAFDSPGILPFDNAPPRQDDVDFDRLNGQLALQWQPADSLQLVSGIDARREHGRNDGSVNFLGSILLPSEFELKRTNLGGFFEGRFRPLSGSRIGLVFNASARIDKPESLGSVATFRAGSSLAFPGVGSTIRLNYSEGFKLPSFTALGNSLVGNPELLPEESTSLELAVEQSFYDSALRLTAAAYWNEYTNLIDFEITEFRNVNRDLVESSGLDLSVDYSPGDSLSIGAYLSYLDTRVMDAASGPSATQPRKLRGRPRWHGGMTVSYRLSRAWEISADYFWNHSNLEAAFPFMTASNPDGFVDLEPYQRVDLAVHYELNRYAKLSFSVDNLFDEVYQEAVGFTAPGIEPRLRIAITF